MGASILVLSIALGAISFVVGICPLWFAFSRAHLAALSVFGNGLLLGAALGIVIPEGVEALGESARGEDFPTPRLALALLAGFAFMLIVEQFVGSHSHSSTNGPESVALHARKSTDDVEFDADVEALDDPPVQPRPRESHSDSEASARKRAYPLTLGLCMHGLTDGLALGASAFSSTGADADLSFIVFLALAVHKAPTSLALTTSLLSTSLSHSDCKKHIALFSAATPIGALISYGLFFFLGTKAEWTGLALLVSGGSFLYVATVLRPVSEHDNATKEVGGLFRLALLLAGMIVPFLIALFVGHDH